jgi:hypothetical protein
MRTDDFIRVLAADATPRRRFQSQFALMVACGIAIAALAFFLAVGFRHDLFQAIQSTPFVFKIIVMLALAMIATGAALRTGDPGANVDRWMKALVCVPILLAGATALELIVTPRSEWLPYLVGHSARRCMTLIPFLSIGPLACLLLALRHGAPARPNLAGAIAGLAAGGIAATFYATNCTDDSPLFVVTWFSSATLIVAASGYLVGRRLLVW